MRLLYSNKANRDAEFNRLGGSKAGYKKTSIRNQYLNPKYVADSGVTGPTQFGDDTEAYSVLYGISRPYTATASDIQVRPVYNAPEPTTLIQRPTYGAGGFKRIK